MPRVANAQYSSLTPLYFFRYLFTVLLTVMSEEVECCLKVISFSLQVLFSALLLFRAPKTPSERPLKSYQMVGILYRPQQQII